MNVFRWTELRSYSDSKTASSNHHGVKAYCKRGGKAPGICNLRFMIESSYVLGKESHRGTLHRKLGMAQRHFRYSGEQKNVGAATEKQTPALQFVTCHFTRLYNGPSITIPSFEILNLKLFEL
jgi:hypothetical protein